MPSDELSSEILQSSAAGKVSRDSGQLSVAGKDSRIAIPVMLVIDVEHHFVDRAAIRSRTSVYDIRWRATPFSCLSALSSSDG